MAVIFVYFFLPVRCSSEATRACLIPSSVMNVAGSGINVR